MFESPSQKEVQQTQKHNVIPMLFLCLEFKQRCGEATQ